MRCCECGKVYKGGEGWRIDKGFYSTYCTWSDCLKGSDLGAGYTDLRINKEVLK